MAFSTSSSSSTDDHPPNDNYGKSQPSKPAPSRNAPLIPTAVSSTASHQHQQEQEMLLSFTVPEPPIFTQQLTIASEANPDAPGLLVPETPRTLWMGDLDPWLDEGAIVDLWWQILGKKVEVKLIKPKGTKGEAGLMGLTHSGYCFVEFLLYEDAQQALALNGQLLPDIAMPSQQHFPNNPDNQKKYFRLNWASGATLTAPIVHLPEYSLFVGDLSASTTEAHLLLFFQKSFPTSIKTVRVMTDPISGKSRCFGFVRFTDELERQRALVEINGAWFGGRPLRVALATPRNASTSRKPPDNKGPMPPGMGNPHMSGMSGPLDFMYMGPPPSVHGPPPPAGSMSSAPYGYYPSPMMNEKPSDIPPPLPFGISVGGQQYLDPANTTVFVGGLLSEVSEQTLFTLFKPFGTIQQIKIPPGKNCGFLKYSSREEAEEAILAMEGFIIGGNRVRLGWGRVSANNKKYHQQRQQIAQVAQMQAAAALSMGMDPATAFAAAANAAAGFPPPPQGSMPGSAQGYGPIPMGMPQVPPGMHGMPPYGPLDVQEPLQDDEDKENSEESIEPKENVAGSHANGDNFYYQYGRNPINPHQQQDLNTAFEKLSVDSGPLRHQHPPHGYQFVPYGGYPVPPDYQYPQSSNEGSGDTEEAPQEGKPEEEKS